MSASQERHLHNDDINLIELFSTLWRRKFAILIVAFLFGLLGLGYLLMTSEKYTGEFVLREPTDARLAVYAPLNDGIKEHYGDFLKNTERSNSTTSQFEITTGSLFQDMVRELQSYNTLETALKTHSMEVQKMSASEFSSVRASLLSQFSMSRATEKNPDVYIKFTWPNSDQLLEILNTALVGAEQNLNAENLEFLHGLADNIERRTFEEMLKTEQEIASLIEAIDLETQSKLLFLQEQAAIARELDLADNSLAQGSQDSQVSLNMLLVDKNVMIDETATIDSTVAPKNGATVTAYLRGYKSLEKEIALILSRTDEQNYSLNLDFVSLKRKAIDLKNVETAMQFRKTIDASPFASNTRIFDISKDLIWVTKGRNTSLILALMIMFGLFASCVFILVKDAFQRHKSAQTA